MTKKDAALETRNKYNQRGGSWREMNTKVNPLPPYHPTPSADENTAAAALPFLQVQTEEYIHSAGQRTFIYLETRPLVYWIITKKKRNIQESVFCCNQQGRVCVRWMRAAAAALLLPFTFHRRFRWTMPIRTFSNNTFKRKFI